MRNMYWKALWIVGICGCYMVEAWAGGGPPEEELLFDCPDVELTAEIMDATCPDGNNGSIELILDGTNANDIISYVWTSSNTFIVSAPNKITQLVPGEYAVKVTIVDSMNVTCEVDALFNVDDDPNSISIEEEVNRAACDGQNNGILEVSASGGTPPYSFLWNGESGSNRRDTLSARTYNIIATDAAGCSDTMSFTIANETTPSIDISSSQITDVTCNSGSNGIIEAIVSGMSLNYFWSHDQSLNSAVADGLTAGNYSLFVESQSGCISEEVNFTVSQPAPINANLTVIAAIPCETGGEGTLQADPAGGIEPYTYNWSGSDSEEETAIYTEAGMYSVTVTDMEGCTTVGTPINLPFANPPELIDFPATLSFSDNATQSIRLNTTFPVVSYNWTITATTNINTSAVGYQTNGEVLADRSLDLTFELIDKTEEGLVVLEVTPDAGNCTGMGQVVEIVVTAGECALQPSEIFTPNGDLINDSWELFELGGNPDNYNVTVYSRGGQLVFSASTLASSWSGEGCPDGSYFYLIENRSSGQLCRGIVSIVR